jgi:peptide/nickel transport system substrate-binding protein
MRPRVTVVAMLLSLTLVGGACSRDDGKDAPISEGDAKVTPASNDINPAERVDVQQGGSLRWPLTAIPSDFNAYHARGNTEATFQVLDALLPSVFSFARDAAPILRKEYVSKAAVTATAPKQVVTYTLNRKARWSDGAPITAADFVAQWQALNGSNPAFITAGPSAYEDIESVVPGADEYEVVVTFAEPYGEWRGLFSPLYPASTNNDPNVFNDGWTDKPALSAGPFKLEGVDRAANTITLGRDDTWWGHKAKLDRIVYSVVSTDDQPDALANGLIDFADVGTDLEVLKRAEGLDGVEVRRAAGPSFRHVDFNGVSEVFQDVSVRTAVALAIDRGAIAEAILGPLGLKPVALNNHILMADQKGYKNNAGELASPDAAKAKGLLDKAGWIPGPSGIRAKGATTLTVRFVIPTDVTSSATAAQLIQGMLKEIGVDVKIETVPSAAFFESFIGPGNFDMTTFSWIGTPLPIGASAPTYSQPVGDDIQQNYARIGSPEIDKLFADATAELDPERAVELANQIDVRIWHLVHSLPLYQRPEVIATKKTLANYGALGFASVRYEDIGFTKS